ncbi:MULTISPECIES: (2E,6E)-farnesyl diphosphate synthase [unclassified Colwellia]|uniref:(2E,6E)-farnesyl diphosphate synthase n=1 Tax=unclassified Colwellia TaxID=196834 RepID=UPI0015F4CF78|nr:MULTISPECIES: (2E,6E)-farnesyl diphosphate synthase [unclassified Colwellia]MBA6230656.1 (2E,6E)-farnesyl diphosphate synthase [Colwellia sp. MB02u-7]MBA6234587.1 (2E,6E)-farnesyl diphosphate synthase [Colwellia sp. MB02u-11]MBA6255451.1 (2E,6E)-farnesyl diphosphate synthase [Colwellia sp. MB3u-28]MBA6261591.1 (2E,6E)-farnesyl diphosphate synthase [Colwellia sp. MB3u-41]MBA6301141.1 (2E,6E)-farnesyl diphosphate synthase [Colwellia sp. MB3u-22]
MTQLNQLDFYQTRINQYLADKLAKYEINDKNLFLAMQYGLLIGGKRMRPYLSYITGEALGLKLSDVDGIAAALECIHAFSLIHDDLPSMDDDDLRRGQPTCHKAFNEATAILAGDSLQTLAFDILVNHEFSAQIEPKRLTLIRQLVNASGYQGMCGGQALDISATDKIITLAELEKLHSLKTGALLKASVTMVTEISQDISTDEKDQLAIYAEHVGLAYQVRDDIIDIISSEEELGKPAGSDVSANKSTYPALLGLAGAQQKADNLYQQALQALATLPYNTNNLAEFATFIIKRVH